MDIIESISSEIINFNKFCFSGKKLGTDYNVIQPDTWKNYLLWVLEKYHIEKKNEDEDQYLSIFKIYINYLKRKKLKENCLECLYMLTDVYFDNSTSNKNFIYYNEIYIKNFVKDIFKILSFAEIEQYANRLYLIEFNFNNYFMIKIFKFIIIFFFYYDFIDKHLFNNQNFINFINSIFEKMNNFFKIPDIFEGYKKYLLGLIFQFFEYMPIQYYLCYGNQNDDKIFMKNVKGIIKISFEQGLLVFNTDNNTDEYDFDFNFNIYFFNYFNYLLGYSNDFYREFLEFLLETNYKIIYNTINLFLDIKFLHKKYFKIFEFFDKNIEFFYNSNSCHELIDHIINIYNQKFIKSVHFYFNKKEFSTKYLDEVMKYYNFLDTDNSDVVKIEFFYFYFFFKLLNYEYMQYIIIFKLNLKIEENYKSNNINKFIRNISLMTKLNILNKNFKKLDPYFNVTLLKFFNKIFDDNNTDKLNYFKKIEHFITPFIIFYLNINYKKSNFLKFIAKIFYEGLENNNEKIIVNLIFSYLNKFNSYNKEMLIYNYLGYGKNIYFEIFNYGHKSSHLTSILYFLKNTLLDYFIFMHKDYEFNKIINNFYKKLTKFIINVWGHNITSINQYYHEYNTVISIIHKFLSNDDILKITFLKFFDLNKFYKLLKKIIIKDKLILNDYIQTIIDKTIDYFYWTKDLYYFIKFIYYYQKYFTLDYNNFYKIISNLQLNNYINSNKWLYGFCYLMFIFIQQPNSDKYDEYSYIIYYNYFSFIYSNLPPKIYNLNNIKYIIEYNINITKELKYIIKNLVDNFGDLEFFLKIYLIRYYYKYINFNRYSRDKLISNYIITNMLESLYNLECEINNFFDNYNDDNNDINFIINKVAVNDKKIIEDIFNDYKSIYLILKGNDLEIYDYIIADNNMNNKFELHNNMLNNRYCFDYDNNKFIFN